MIGPSTSVFDKVVDVIIQIQTGESSRGTEDVLLSGSL